ncbi:MAG: DUF5979 domain-containing protein, partial [Propionicimonas sp.]
ATAQPWLVEDLPTGADCVVTETAAGAANSTGIANAAFTVGTGTSQTTVTNTYTLGAVRVSKLLTLDGAPSAAEPWTLGSYTVELTCSRPVNGVATPISIPGGASRTLTGAGTVTYTDLPTGASCALAETASSPASQQTTVGAAVTVGADPASPQAISVTNDFHTAQLAIRKQLAGAGADAFGDGPFDFSVSCTLDGAGEVFTTTARLARRAGSPATTLVSASLGAVPVGSLCQITEVGHGGADTTADPVTLTIAEDDAANVATLTNQFSAGTVWLSKQLTGDAAGEPWATGATFAVDVTCQVEVDGEPGTVFSRRVWLAGGDRLNVTGADGLPSRIPLGAHCFSTEVDAQGAGSSVDAHDSYQNAVVVAGGTPASLQALELTVTNTFEYAGFSVTKDVANSGATDEDGDPVGYDARFGFRADCTLAGRSVLAQQFTLQDGGSREFTGLPAGAGCTVTETATADAVATTAVVTQNGASAPPVAGTAAAFTLQRGWFPLFADAAAHNVAGFTNTYAAGAVTVTKVVTGPGAEAWGNGPFTVRAVCTLDADADPATAAVTVFDDARQVTRTSPTWRIGDLPAGAECVVTETATGGANTAAQPLTVVVNDDPAAPVAVQLTNDFATGSVVLGKRILVDGEPSAAQPYASASYQVQLRCVRDIDGTEVAVDIPGDGVPAGDPADGVRTITGAGSVRYDGLPTGADCTGVELSAGLPLPPAQVADGASVTVPDATTAELEITNDYHTGELVVSKLLAGSGAAAYADGEFRFDVTCTLADIDGVAHPVFGATGLVLSRADGLTSDALGPIPVGAD